MSSGRISAGLVLGTLAEKTVAFVKEQLVGWRDDPTRPHESAEPRLNAQLCKFLNAFARSRFPMIAFNHEERQPGRHATDMSVTMGRVEAVSPGANIYDPFLLIEGKRLPAPATDREQEYLTGFARRSGGIQRFKLGLHGAGMSRGMIVGYVQAGALAEWFRTLNTWIGALAREAPNDHDAWEASEKLHSFGETPDGMAVCDSEHARASGDPVQLHHAWIDMSRIETARQEAQDDARRQPIRGRRSRRRSRSRRSAPRRLGASRSSAAPSSATTAPLGLAPSRASVTGTCPSPSNA